MIDEIAPGTETEVRRCPVPILSNDRGSNGSGAMGAWLGYRMRGGWPTTLFSCLLVSSASVVCSLAWAETKGWQDDMIFTFVVLTLGVSTAWRGSHLFLAERGTGIFAEILFSPSGTRGLVRGEAVHEAIFVFSCVALWLLSVIGAAGEVTPAGQMAPTLARLALGALQVGAAVIVVWCLAGMLALHGADPFAAFLVSVICIPQALNLQRRVTSGSLAIASVPILIAAAITWATLIAMERRMRQDAWRLRSSRL